MAHPNSPEEIPANPPEIPFTTARMGGIAVLGGLALDVAGEAMQNQTVETVGLTTLAVGTAAVIASVIWNGARDAYRYLSSASERGRQAASAREDRIAKFLEKPQEP